MLTSLLNGICAGAGWMYFYDPDQGRRRRALLRDQLNSFVHRTTNDLYRFIDVGQRDLRNRTQGLMHEGRARMTEESVPDTVLRERVRAALGHYVTHASDVEVDVQDGHVVVSGPVEMHEAPGLLNAISHVRGVRDVEGRLQVRNDSSSGRRQAEAMSSMWTPGARLLAAGVGAALMANCLVRRTPSAVLGGTLGFGLFIRASSNRPISQATETFVPSVHPGTEAQVAQVR